MKNSCVCRIIYIMREIMRLKNLKNLNFKSHFLSNVTQSFFFIFVYYLFMLFDFALAAGLYTNLFFMYTHSSLSKFKPATPLLNML